MHFKIKYIFRILALITTGNFFLLIISNNLPFPFTSPLFYLIIWLIVVLIVYPKILISKSLFLIYFFIVVYLFFIPFYWQERVVGWENYVDYKWLRSEIQPVLLAILMYLYFIKSGDFKGLAIVTLFTLVFIVITSITSIIAINVYPTAARELAGALAIREEKELIEIYNKMGVGSYGFFNGIAFLFPIFFFFLKKQWSNSIYKILFIGMIILLFLGIIKAKFASALLLSFFFFLSSFFISKYNKHRTLLYAFFSLFFLFFSFSFLSNLFYEASSLFEGTVLQERLYDAGQTIEDPVIDYERSSHHTGRRLGRIPILIVSFLENPFIGGGVNTGHVFWFDRLSMFGLIGFIPWLLIIKHQIKLNLFLFSEDFKQYYLLSILAFIFLGMIKNMGGNQIFITIFFITPGMYYLKLLFNNDFITNRD
jgi:hypothetical protein